MGRPDRLLHKVRSLGLIAFAVVNAVNALAIDGVIAVVIAVNAVWSGLSPNINSHRS